MQEQRSSDRDRDDAEVRKLAQLGPEGRVQLDAGPIQGQAPEDQDPAGHEERPPAGGHRALGLGALESRELLAGPLLGLDQLQRGLVAIECLALAAALPGRPPPST